MDEWPKGGSMATWPDIPATPPPAGPCTECGATTEAAYGWVIWKPIGWEPMTFCPECWPRIVPRDGVA